MRIISQDGTVDVPYEQAIVEYEACERNGEDVFYIIFARTEKSYFSIARYSTESKVQKAMEMLRESYNNYVFAINLFFDEMLKSYANSHSKEDFNKLAYPYFRFPADEYLEG